MENIDHGRPANRKASPFDKEKNIICSCHGISEHDIETGVISGIDTFEKFQEKTGIGNGKGKCLPGARSLFHEYRAKYLG
ncbi:MAG: (2Fe-2S)-binding protein [Nitrospinota bacterium]|nr:(2Fe-2S)-binding protein [Nitrospinota bacterium]